MKKSILLLCLPLIALTSCGSGKGLTPEEAKERLTAVKAKSQKITQGSNYKVVIAAKAEGQNMDVVTSTAANGDYSISADIKMNIGSDSVDTKFSGVCLKAEDVCYFIVKAAGADVKVKYSFDNPLVSTLGDFNWNEMTEGLLGQVDQNLTSLTGKVKGSTYMLSFASDNGEFSMHIKDDLINKIEQKYLTTKLSTSLTYLNKLTVSVPEDASSYIFITPPPPSERELTIEEAKDKYAAIKTKSQDIDLTKNYKISGKITENANTELTFEISFDPEGNYYTSYEARLLFQGMLIKSNTKGVCIKAEDACYLEVKDGGVADKLKYPYKNDVSSPLNDLKWNDMFAEVIAQADTILTTSQTFLSGVVIGSKYTLEFNTDSLDISIFADDDVVTKLEMDGGEWESTVSLAYLDELTITAPSDASSYIPAPTV